jgi:hypothetical protein
MDNTKPVAPARGRRPPPSAHNIVLPPIVHTQAAIVAPNIGSPLAVSSGRRKAPAPPVQPPPPPVSPVQSPDQSPAPSPSPPPPPFSTKIQYQKPKIESVFTGVDIDDIDADADADADAAADADADADAAADADGDADADADLETEADIRHRAQLETNLKESREKLLTDSKIHMASKQDTVAPVKRARKPAKPETPAANVRTDTASVAVLSAMNADQALQTIPVPNADEVDSDGKWITRFGKHPGELKTIYDFLGFLEKNYTGFGGDATLDEICNKMCLMSYAGFKEMYYKSRKKEQKKKDKFIPAGFKMRPPTARGIFITELVKYNKEHDIKMQMMEQNQKWMELPEERKDRYRQQADILRAQHAEEYANLKKTAIDTGDFPEPLPKRSPSAYLRFRIDELPRVRAVLPLPKYDKLLANKTEEEQTVLGRNLKKEYTVALNVEISRRWQAITPERKQYYNDAYMIDKEKYDLEMIDWKIRKAERAAHRQTAAV